MQNASPPPSPKVPQGFRKCFYKVSKSCWLLAVRCWLLAASCWEAAADRWLLAAGNNLSWPTLCYSLSSPPNTHPTSLLLIPSLSLCAPVPSQPSSQLGSDILLHVFVFVNVAHTEFSKMWVQPVLVMCEAKLVWRDIFKLCDAIKHRRCSTCPI